MSIPVELNRFAVGVGLPPRMAISRQLWCHVNPAKIHGRCTNTHTTPPSPPPPRNLDNVITDPLMVWLIEAVESATEKR